MKFTIGIQLTQQCNTSCEHCGTYSSPRSQITCDRQDLDHWISQIAHLCANGHIGFTGGEPFIQEDLLWHAIAETKRHGLDYGVITNGFWGKSENRRDAILTRLNGCSNLSISTDVFHQRTVSRDVLLKIFHGALDKGIDVSLHYTTIKGEDEGAILSEWGLSAPEYQKRVTFSGLMPIGRGMDLSRTTPQYFPECGNTSEPCLSLSVPVIRADGTLFACCGGSLHLDEQHPLRLGHLHSESLQELLASRDSDVVVQALRTIGPGRFLSSIGSDITSTDEYDEVLRRSPCGCCHLLFRNLAGRRVVEQAATQAAAQIRILKALQFGEV